jgi:hypothetical protein
MFSIVNYSITRRLEMVSEYEKRVSAIFAGERPWPVIFFRKNAGSIRGKLVDDAVDFYFGL